MFSDITGSTELGQVLDPELVRGILAKYYDAMRRLMEKHGGTVEKFIGDAVMAVFGIPHLHEDDALRAIRAASEISDVLTPLNAELEGAWGLRIETRTGIDTGEVVIGDTATAETLVTGMPSNVAARLEQAALPGEILISEETYRLVRDALLTEMTDPLALKGVGQAIRAHRVLKVDPDAAGFARRLDAPIVGRDRELALLRDAFDRAVSDDACQLFTVLGVGGVGKSRLVRAFVDDLPQGVIALRGRCLPYGDGITFWSVAEAVRQVAGLTGSERADEAMEKLVELLPADEHTERIARQLVQLLGLSSGELAPEEPLWAIRRFLEGIALQGPVTFIIDDVQWAETMMLDLIEYLADWVTDRPLLIACMARPELLDVRPAWGGGKLNATSISLEPLSSEECGKLVTNLLAIDNVDAIVRDRIVDAAEGHPLFAEEMLAMLVDDGRVVRRGTSWVAEGDLSDVMVPPTMAALLSSRLDRLSPAERSVLERASAMGQVFYRDALEHLADGAVETELAALVRKQFVRQERSDIPGFDALAFRHLMIRDAAYEGTSKALRAQLHERFADWLEGRAPELEELIGYHLERADRYLRELGSASGGSLAARASVHLRVSGRRAFDRMDIGAAADLFGRAIDLMDADDAEFIPTLTALAIASGEGGDFQSMRSRLDDAIESAGDPLVEARARLVGTWALFWEGLPDSQEVEAKTGADLAMFERAGDDVGMAWASVILGSLSWMRCRAEDTRLAWRRAVDLFRKTGDEHMAGEYLSWLASTPVWGPTPCSEALQQIAALQEEADSIAIRAEVAATSSTLYWMIGDFDEARRICETAHRQRLEIGRRVADAHMTQAAGWIELMAGNPAEAEQILGEGWRELISIGTSAATIVSAMRAHALYALGRYDDAEAAAAAGWDDDPNDIQTNALVLEVRAMIAARRGAVEEADSLARSAVGMLANGDFINDQADAFTALAEVLELAGRTDEAAVATMEALERYQRKGNVTQSDTSESRLARLGGGIG